MGACLKVAIHGCMIEVVALSLRLSFSVSSLECSRHQDCLVTTLQIQPGVVRCVFYPDIQNCIHSLRSPTCWLLLHEEATYIYRKSGECQTEPLQPYLGAGDAREGYFLGGLEDSGFATRKGDMAKGCWLGSILLGELRPVG